MTDSATLIAKKEEQQKIIRSFAYYNIGVFLCWAAFVAIFNLQSSINIEDGLGTITLAVSYGISVIFAISCAPIMIRKFGIKICLIIGDVAPIPYMLANLYPTYYTLLPAGILMACLQSPSWPTMSVTNVWFATQYSAVSKRSEAFHVMSFSGYFFVAFQTSQVFGNLISYVVLYGLDQIPIQEMGLLSNCTNINDTTCKITSSDYRYCGINDCQNETVISEQIAQYKPVNRLSLYVLVGVTICLEIIAGLVHGFHLPSKETFAKSNQLHEKSESHTFSKKSCGDNSLINKEENGIEEIGMNDNVQKEFNLLLVEESIYAPAIELIDEGIFSISVNTTKAVFVHCINWKFILLIPITLYNGLAMSFCFTELTRAFAACSLGVQWVGICMAVYGVSDAILSWVIGRFGRKIGYIPCYLFGLLFECGNYLQCMFWPFQNNLLLSVILLFFCFGFSDGIFQTIINVTHIDFFETNREVSMSVWNLLIVIGFAIGYALSTVFCVRTRIYFNLAFLIIGCGGVIVAQLYYKSRPSSKLNKQKNDTETNPM